MMMVLDASALLALARGEPGADLVEELLQSSDCVASAVNMAEVGAKLIDLGLPPSELDRAMAQFNLAVIDFDAQLASISAALRPITRSAGLSLGDRACLALAKQLKAPAVTADSAWLDVADAVGLEVVMIR